MRSISIKSTPVPISILNTLPWGQFRSSPWRTVVPVLWLKIALTWPIRLATEVYSRFTIHIDCELDTFMSDTFTDDVLYLTALLGEDQSTVVPRLSGIIPDCGAWIRSRSYVEP